MQTVYITFRSITAAQRGERILKEAGIPAAMQRTPRWMQERGCGYCLRLREDRAAPAVGALRSEKIPFTRIYRPEEGKLLEVAL